MANIKQPLTPDELKKLGITAIKNNYNDLAETFNKVLDKELLMCPKCGDFLKAESGFYYDNNYAANRYPICKRCLLQMVEQRKNSKDEPNETKESVQKVLQMMDRVYDDKFYEDCVKGALDGVKEKNRSSPFTTYITALQSLPNWKGKTWKDSNFGDETSINEEDVRIIQKTVRNGRKRFGSGYSDEDYMFLENEYQDWITRYECNTKAQEEVFENLSLIKLLKKKAMASGQSTKDLDNQHQNWLDAGRLKPKQNSMDTMSDAQVLGTLLQKWEETRPLPEIDPELEDVDKIGLYIDSFFRGHTSKMLGLKNGFSHIYEKVMSKYTVTKPQYNDESDSEAIFEKVFGSNNEE